MIYLLGAALGVLAIVAVTLFGRLRRLEERVARLEGRADPGPYRGAPPRPLDPEPAPPAAPREDAIDDLAIADALDRGNVIAAIKRYRELTGEGLKESKDAVEALRDRRRRRGRG